MKSLKRNQVIIFVIALMLVSAGYLSYTANNDANTIQTSTELNTTLEYAGIGDAKLVNSNGVVDSNTVNENAITNEQLNNENIENKNVETKNKENVVETNAK